MKRLILTLTALAGLAIGASAQIQMVSQLPTVIDKPGNYLLDPAAVVDPVYSNVALIQITGNNVNLDLNGLTIECSGQGLVIGGIPYSGQSYTTNHVSVKNGTFDGMGPAPTATGLAISNGCDNVSVTEVSFTGGWGSNFDWGAYTTLKNDSFSAILQLYSLGPFETGITAGHGQYNNLSLSAPVGTWALNSFEPAGFGFVAPFNDFKNITVLSGIVNLSAGDTYQHFFYQPPTQVIGGTNVQPGKH
jgi:hypothetical protein